ncbi:MAG: hypothetical protein NT135_01335 [Candidatus Berkelbacteria bacterium]|nr:hypothetical protein [Candidatus Berkelbacteria bacterium]
MFCSNILRIKKRTFMLIVFILLFLLFSIIFYANTSKAEEIKTIAQAKQEARQQEEKDGKGIQATISGFVTAQPNQLSKQYFYIQDETGGIQIYKYEGGFPIFSLGQKIKVTGEIYELETQKEFRLKVSSLEVLPDIQIVQPIEVNKIEEQVEGQLVLLKGLYAGSCSGGFYLEKNGEKTKISITSAAVDKIKKPKMERDDLIEIIGIVSQYDTAKLINNYRVLPRFSEDIKILESSIELEGKEDEAREVISLISIKEARNKEKDSEVLVEGTVTAKPGIVSSYYFYIQDATSGIQVYFSKKNFPKIDSGQKIQAKGIISEAYKEKRIKIYDKEDIKILSKGNLPSPIFLKTGTFREEYEGQFVKTKGKVVKTSGNTFYLDDGTGKIKIYIKKETQIKKPKMKKGDTVEISGILSQYNDSYRILPYLAKNIKLTKVEEKEIAEEEEISPEEVTESTNEATTTAGKVLGASKKGNYINWKTVFYTLIFAGLPTFGFLGYLYYDYHKQKRTKNPTI